MLKLFFRSSRSLKKTSIFVHSYHCRDMATDATGSHKDPVTGEMVSKTSVLFFVAWNGVLIDCDGSELKRREKQREKEARKQSAPPNAQTSTKAKDTSTTTHEDDLNPNVSGGT